MNGRDRAAGALRRACGVAVLLLATGSAGAQDVCEDNVLADLTCSSVISGQIDPDPSYDTWWEDGIQCSTDQDWVPDDSDLGGYCNTDPRGPQNCFRECFTSTQYGCGPLIQEGPEDIYAFRCQQTGSVTLEISDMDCDLDMYILEGACDPAGACIASSVEADLVLDTVSFSCVAGTTYYVIIEAWGYGYDAFNLYGLNGAGYCRPETTQRGAYDLAFDVSQGTGCVEDCDNGIDDDLDTLIDCDDPNCFGDPLCNCDDDGDGYDSLFCGGNDCDDLNADRHPTRPETCDGRDNDCDIVVDEGTDCYDDDHDGFTEDWDDCDDNDPNAFPGATEACDSVDNDCDGTEDEGSSCYDDDGDCRCEVAPCAGSIAGLGACGILGGGDCNDANDDVRPGVAEVDGDGIDNDCDGSVDGGAYDPDGDGYTSEAGDCLPNDADSWPGAPETPDGVDNDCDDAVDDGTTAADDDGDGYCEGANLDADPDDECSDGSAPGDCNDAVLEVNPEAEEVQNGVDDDCDGSPDEGGPYSDDDGDGFTEQAGDCDDASDAVHPGAEEAENALDDDCDGTVDEGLVDVDEDGWSVEQGDCDDAEGWANPDLPEMCGDSIDNNCDGVAEEDCIEPESENPARQCGCAAPGAPPGVGWVVLALLAARRRRGGAA